jgi:Tfp pilus assembly protein PilO
MDINFDKLKNFKIEDLKGYLESYKELLKDKTFVTKVGVGLVVFFINFTIYSVWLSPKLAEQSLKIKTMDDYKKKTVQYNANFGNLQNELNSFKNVTNSVNLFFSKKESEELYQNLSTYATSNGLNITNLVKGTAQKVNVGGAPATSKDGKPSAPGTQYYYKIPDKCLYVPYIPNCRYDFYIVLK